MVKLKIQRISIKYHEMSEERYNELMRAARFAGYLEMIRKNEELIKATMDDQ